MLPRRRAGKLGNAPALVCALAAAVAAGPAVAVALADDTPPTVSPAITGTAGGEGWYRSPVEVRWLLYDPEGPVTPGDGCEPVRIEVETAARRVQCSAESAGGTTTVSKTIRTDWTPPEPPVATPDRPPDTGDWYNRTFGVAFSGVDGLAGIAGCTSTSYSGPDADPALVSGTCTDHAGNTSVPTSLTIRYDATPPVLDRVAIRPGYQHVDVTWLASTDAEAVEVVRTAPGPPAVVYRGKAARFRDLGLVNGERYEYSVTAVDRAGNIARGTVVARPGRRLLSPAAGARLRRPPILRWTRMLRASYYNVQLFRGGRRILSTWPRTAGITVPRSWRYRGRRYTLRPGRYRWYVWPGYGRRTENRYGHRLGARSFVILRRG